VLRLPRPSRAIACLALVVLISAVSFAAPWPVVDSDLSSDPSARFGTLPNGLRYVILPNAEPKNRVSLRLLVAAGSLHERDDEQGLAHFVEHMAFRGTRRHPGDSLSKELARLGIGFGPDSTAFTGHNYTVYHLELPDASAGMLRRGLDVLHEYASEINFDQALIERERGVILSEKATRDTPGARLSNAQLKSLWPSAREVRRAPIGLEESIRRFTKKQLVAFYDAWYRPERLAVIIVGNVDPPTAENLVNEAFRSLKARAPAREEPTDMLTAAAATPTVDGWLDVGLIGMEFSLQHPTPDPRAPDTHARRAVSIRRMLALAILQRRLGRIAHTTDSAFVSPTATLNSPIPGWLVVALTVSGRIDNWKTYAAAVEQEHRRAFIHGFTQDEVDNARAALRLSYEQAVRSAATRPSEQLAAMLEGALLNGQVFTTPEALRDDLVPAIVAATPRECTEAFRSLWSHQAPHIFVGSNPTLHIRKQDIAEVLNESRQIEVKPPEARPPIVFAYANPGPPGKLVREESVPDLDLHLAEFSNGVRLNFKSTPFEADLVTVRVRVGTGQISEPRDQPGLSLLSSYALTGGGLRRHSLDELRELLSGHALQVSFAVEGDACVFTTRCARAELPLCLQVVTAYLTDSAYRPEALKDAHANFGSMYANLAASASGPISFKVERTLIRDDRRFGYPESQEIYARTLEEVAHWLEPQFRRGPIELAVVGDVSWADASSAVARTIGALPARDPRPPLVEALTFATPSTAPYVASSSSQLKQAAVAWFWPAPDLVDVHRERRCRFLSEVITERLRLRLREELGAAYAPEASFVQHEGIPSFAYFSLYAEVAPAQIVRAAEVIRREIDALHTQGLTEDEFLSVRQPFLRAREDDLRSNDYWAYTVLDDAQQHPERLVAARDRARDTAAITRAEINALAAHYLDPARGFMFVAEPGVTHLWNRK
jgi:zinc protease